MVDLSRKFFNMDGKWDALIAEFQKLGGIADNVCQRDGKNGRGIFPINLDQKSRIFTPSKLMIKVDDIYLEKGNLRIKEDKIYSENLRDFFNYYQDNFSWGCGGKDRTESFEKELKNLNSEVKAIVKDNLKVDLELRHDRNWDDVVMRRFLEQRQFEFSNTQMICPILELVNHTVNSFPFTKNSYGISTPNYSPLRSELTHYYCYKGPIRRLLEYGFFCEETIIFSFPFTLSFKELDIHLVCNGLDLKNDNMNIKFSDKKITFDGLPIFSLKVPSLPKNYLNQLITRMQISKLPKDFLQRIIQYNLKIRRHILDILKSSEDSSSLVIQSAINYEIDSISND